MAGDWVKMEKATARKPEILRIAAVLGIHPDHAFGLCFRFWSWCDDHLTTGNASGVTAALVDALLDRSGFSDALISVGWLRSREGSIEIPNFDRHLSESAKNRALTAQRVAKCKNKKSNAKVTVKALPEKRREEKRKTLTHTPFVDLEGVSLAISGIEIDGEVVSYGQDSLRWEAEFVRQWNSLKDVSNHLEFALDTFERRLLLARFGEPDWFWKRAVAAFPLWSESGWKPSLLWFLEEGSVNKIISGKYSHTEERKDGQRKAGKGTGRGAQAIGPGQRFDPAGAAKRGVDDF